MLLLDMHLINFVLFQDAHRTLEKAWDNCLTNMHELIPAYKIKVFDEKTNNPRTIYLRTLTHFKDRKQLEDELSVDDADPDLVEASEANHYFSYLFYFTCIG